MDKNNKPVELVHCIYTSVANEKYDHDEMVLLLDIIRANNKKLHVTGMLLYDDGSFFQVLEGDKADVNALFMKIEKDIIKFIWVKFVISFFTGVGFTLACIFFEVSFPVFWGLFAFLINFVQMVGSIISVILLSLFALVELDPTVTLIVFIAVITGVQVLMGSILEPIFLGKTFSINVITVLVMLMLWGFIWGVPGLVMAIPLTVFIKIVLEKFSGTQMIARLMSGS